MKSLLLLLMLGTSFLTGTEEGSHNTNQGLEIQLKTDLVFQHMVRIYSYEGDLIRELTVEDVANNDISVADYLILQDSDFAFDHRGDYYYFRESGDISGFN